LRAAAVRQLKASIIAVLKSLIASGSSNIADICSDEDEIFDIEGVLKQIGLEASYDSSGEILLFISKVLSEKMIINFWKFYHMNQMMLMISVFRKVALFKEKIVFK
jgi:hypothetical protein